MLLAALRDEQFLHAWIVRDRGEPTERDAYETIVELSRLPAPVNALQ